LKCCGSLFTDDIVLIAPSQMAMDHLLERVQAWALKNEMVFDINKCATLAVKLLRIGSTLDPEPLGDGSTFNPQPLNVDPTLDSQPLTDHDPDPTFYLGTESLPQTPNYTYLGVPFDENLSLDHSFIMYRTCLTCLTVQRYTHGPRNPRSLINSCNRWKPSSY